MCGGGEEEALGPGSTKQYTILMETEFGNNFYFFGYPE
jgi:hypothetical protein